MPEDNQIAQANEFTRTPFRSPFGYTHPERCKTEMCPYCKNEDTRRMNGLELTPYEEYHAGQPFKAFECHACGAKFHFATPLPSTPKEPTMSADKPIPELFAFACHAYQRRNMLAGLPPHPFTVEQEWELLTRDDRDRWWKKSIDDASPPEPSRRAYSREELRDRVTAWLCEQYGRPIDLDEEAKDRWLTRCGLIYAFVCDHFPENDTTRQPT